MIMEPEWYDMKDKQRQGMSISQIAREEGIDRKTVRKHLRSRTPPKYRRRKEPRSKLDQFKDYIKEQYGLHHLSAVKMLEVISEMGYTGGYTILKDFMRPLRGDVAIPAEIRYETEPGEQAQVDWFYIGKREIDGEMKKIWCFSMILGYSRSLYIEFTTDVTTATFIRCHMNAFNFLGGCTKTILYDNTKNVVIKRALKSSDSVWNPLFEDFRTHYGFTARLCKPGKEGAKTKGKVERTGPYIRGNFLAGLDFISIPDWNSRGLVWCRKVGQRIHGTTHEVPNERLKEEVLIPTNDRPPYQIILTEYRKISRDCYISYRSNKYSVPWRHAGRRAKLLINNDRMEIEIDGETICTHEIIDGQHRLIKEKEHFAGLYKTILHRNRDEHIGRMNRNGMGGDSVKVSWTMRPMQDITVQKRSLEIYDDVLNYGGEDNE